MGIHAGEAVGGRDYTGLDVHRAARIMAAAQGGQMLVSEQSPRSSATPSRRWTLRDLGAHRLRDLADPGAAVPARRAGSAVDFRRRARVRWRRHQPARPADQLRGPGRELAAVRAAARPARAC